MRSRPIAILLLAAILIGVGGSLLQPGMIAVSHASDESEMGAGPDSTGEGPRWVC